MTQTRQHGAAELTRFTDFELDPQLLRAVEEAGFASPRPIQQKAIPHALAGRDIVGLAQTGTGKTAAFALPMLQRLIAKRGQPGRTRGLVVAPTRELTQQISEEIARLGKHVNVRLATLIGGVSPHAQIEALRRGAQIIVACPGRLLDLQRQGHVSLAAIETLVLDEADHMFDMGFLPDLRRILNLLPRNRQSLLFSATMPDEIRQLAQRYLREAVVVECAPQRPAETIEHGVFEVEEGQKLDLLHRLLAASGPSSAIVFARTKHRAKRLALKLCHFGHRAVALQGNMSQNQRQRAMDGFRQQEFDVLVATDIAARGIDVAGVGQVINYDVPNTADAYTHRIGRTGRAERSGQGYTFVTSADRASLRAIERRIGRDIVRLAEGKLPTAPPTEPIAPHTDPPRIPTPAPRSERPRRTTRSDAPSAQQPPRRRRRRRPQSQRSAQTES
ncbi:MAG: DEAD/DEAH box helicase [Deltaproteobacteria bacterium]|nr:DEAD/DEAH box helicase [Deltaproteobacteria bacterium]